MEMLEREQRLAGSAFDQVSALNDAVAAIEPASIVERFYRDMERCQDLLPQSSWQQLDQVSRALDDLSRDSTTTAALEAMASFEPPAGFERLCRDLERYQDLLDQSTCRDLERLLPEPSEVKLLPQRTEIPTPPIYIPPAPATEEGQERRAQELRSRMGRLERRVHGFERSVARHAHRARLQGIRAGRKQERRAWLIGLATAAFGALLGAIATALLTS